MALLANKNARFCHQSSVDCVCMFVLGGRCGLMLVPACLLEVLCSDGRFDSFY